MLQKPWFKLFIWFLATFFFFLASATIISLLKPGPSETDVMKYMSGMMSAMENSIMGTMMGVEGNQVLRMIMTLTIALFPLAAVLSIIAGLILRKRSSKEKHV